MTGLSKDLLNRVLDSLDFGEPPAADVAALQRLYTSWCIHVPFDNVRKMIVLKSEVKRPLPGLDAAEFFENWLKNGSGATCWPMANAFYELIILLGNTRFSKTVNGIKRRDLSRDEVCKALEKDIGISASLINEWVGSGSLDASFEPPSGAPPPPSPMKPPSQRMSNEK